VSDALDAEIVAAFDRLELRPRRWRRIATLPPGYGRSVFRVELDNGVLVKARRMEDATAALCLQEMRAAAPPGYAPILHRHAEVLIERWIDGEDLARRDATTAELVAAATLLAQLHRVEHASGQALPTMRDTAPERKAADGALTRLEEDGALRPADADAISSALARLDPGRTLCGLVHTDFCGENIVVDANGRLHAIDNERMEVGPFGLDVARTWYRWRLPDADWEHFRASYRERMPHDDALRHFAFWALVATLKGSLLLSRLNPARAHVALERLRQAIANVETLER